MIEAYAMALIWTWQLHVPVMFGSNGVGGWEVARDSSYTFLSDRKSVYSVFKATYWKKIRLLKQLQCETKALLF